MSDPTTSSQPSDAVDPRQPAPNGILVPPHYLGTLLNGMEHARAAGAFNNVDLVQMHNLTGVMIQVRSLIQQ